MFLPFATKKCHFVAICLMLIVNFIQFWPFSHYNFITIKKGIASKYMQITYGNAQNPETGKSI